MGTKDLLRTFTVIKDVGPDGRIPSLTSTQKTLYEDSTSKVLHPQDESGTSGLGPMSLQEQVQTDDFLFQDRDYNSKS